MKKEDGAIKESRERDRGAVGLFVLVNHCKNFTFMPRCSPFLRDPRVPIKTDGDANNSSHVEWIAERQAFINADFCLSQTWLCGGGHNGCM